MTEWLLPFLIGVGATVFGFLLTMAWDIYKNNRDAKKREETIIDAVKEEINLNIKILNYNAKAIKTDIKLIQGEKSLVMPLTLLHSSFWDLIKQAIPKNLVKIKFLKNLRECIHTTSLINEGMKSRENYRINNQAMPNFFSIMESYNEILLKQSDYLTKAFQELKSLLN